jgi:tellurite resistance protein
MPSTWAFTFAWAAVASVTLHWLQDLKPAGYRGYQYLILTAISALIGAIALRTLVAVRQRQLLPQPAPTAAAHPDFTPGTVDADHVHA